MNVESNDRMGENQGKTGRKCENNSFLSIPTPTVEEENNPEKEAQTEENPTAHHFLRSEKIEEAKERLLDEERIQKMRVFVSRVTLVGFIVMMLLGLYAWHLGLFEDVSKFDLIIQKSGVWGVLLFLLLQIFQCVIPIIPGNVSSLVGIYAFGPWKGFLLNYIGVYLGEVAIFLLARKLGETFVRSMMKKETYEKYSRWVIRRDKGIRRFFVITMVLPGMPDDVICMLMGLTNMPLSYFMVHLAWTKVPSLFLYTLFLDTAFRKGGDVLKWLKGLGIG